MKQVFFALMMIVNSYAFSQSLIYVGNNTISSNFNFSNLLDIHKDKNKNIDEIKGYRIQIISNNNRTNVYNQKARVYEHFSEFKSYLKYVQPYYKLRIGDFKTRLEARSYLEKVIKVFPSAFIVFDDIKLR